MGLGRPGRAVAPDAQGPHGAVRDRSGQEQHQQGEDPVQAADPVVAVREAELDRPDRGEREAQADLAPPRQ